MISGREVWYWSLGFCKSYGLAYLWFGINARSKFRAQMVGLLLVFQDSEGRQQVSAAGALPRFLARCLFLFYHQHLEQKHQLSTSLVKHSQLIHRDIATVVSREDNHKHAKRVERGIYSFSAEHLPASNTQPPTSQSTHHPRKLIPQNATHSASLPSYDRRWIKSTKAISPIRSIPSQPVKANFPTQ